MTERSAWALGALCLALVLSASDAAVAQLAEAEAIRARAQELLRAYAAQDVDHVVELIAPPNRSQARAALAEGSPRRASIFGETSWRWRAVRAWDGRLHEVRRRGDQARVHFGDLPDGEIAVVTLRKVDGVWYFDDVHSPAASDFATWGERLQ